MYESPIKVIYGQMQTQMEGDIFRAVQNYHVDVDKDELILALKYDRDQYEKGFRDGAVASEQKWIPVTERLPEHGKSVLCYKRLGYMQILQFNERTDRWYGWDCSFPLRAVTHWMPLPNSPEGGDSDETL